MAEVLVGPTCQEGMVADKTCMFLEDDSALWSHPVQLSFLTDSKLSVIQSDSR
jgi:hypothetical protein